MSFDARAGGYAPGPPGAGSAEAAYAQYRRRLELGEALDFDEFCAGRPELAPALQALHSVYAGGPVQEESSFAKVIEENLVPPVPSGEAPVLPGAETLTLPDRPAAGERSRLPPGRRYRFQEEVARGGMGVILKAWDEVLNRPLAVKVLLRPGGGGSDDPDMLRRFLEEAQITGQLEHPGIVPVHELGVNEDGRPYFAMRLVKGRNLGEVFALARAGQEAWSLPRAIGVLVKVCEAVAYAHAKGVIHRDLKPANIMVGRLGETYVMDWGLAKVEGMPDARAPAAELEARDGLDPSDATASLVCTAHGAAGAGAAASSRTLQGTIMGTPAYMPPEQAQGKIESLDARSDVYSLGAMLYELLTGRPPYAEAGKDPLAVLEAVRRGPPAPTRALARRLPAELEAICEKAMARRPEDRYPSSAELSADLQAFLEVRVVHAHRTGPLVELEKWTLRNKGTAASLAAAVAAAVVAAALRLNASWELTLRSDRYLLQGLATSAERDLWPANPRKVREMESWLEKAREISARLPYHRERLRDAAPEDKLERDTLAQLVSGLEAFNAPIDGTIARVERWHDFARTLWRRSLEEPRDRWERAIASISSRDECPAYGGLRIVPQLGLVPVGRDPSSGLWEFAVLGTGALPERGPDGRLRLDGDPAVILVLLPGGTYRMGAERPSEEKPLGSPNVDPHAVEREGPAHEVQLDPFFLAKHEVTQGQWTRLAGENPSYYHAGRRLKPSREGQPDITITVLHPVEQVSWEMCQEVLARVGLTLPTEAQWEYGARGGTGTVWWCGDERESLLGPPAKANLADRSARDYGATWVAIEEWPGYDDGHPFHAPAGAFPANPFGLHDVMGNVWEWCREPTSVDAYKRPSLRPGDGEQLEGNRALRADRGSSYSNTALNARSACRNVRVPGMRSADLGVRAARPLVRGEESTHAE